MKAIPITAQLISYKQRVDRSMGFSFVTTHEFTQIAELHSFFQKDCVVTISDAPLSQESVEVIQSTPIEPKQERFSASQKLRFAIIGLHKRLGSNTDPESFYQATIQEYINQLNKQGI